MNMATPQPRIVSEQIKQTTCPYCGVGCGVDISCNVSERTLTLDNVKGTPEHPANFGRLCVKGTNLLETNDLKGRLLHPTIAGKLVDWDTATVVWCCIFVAGNCCFCVGSVGCFGHSCCIGGNYGPRIAIIISIASQGRCGTVCVASACCVTVASLKYF